MDIKTIVKNNTVKFIYYKKGIFYYSILFEGETYQFPVPIEDIGDATLPFLDKAITFMRWIRKSLEDNTFQKLFINQP